MSLPPNTRKVEVVIRVEIVCAEDQENAIYDAASQMATASHGIVKSVANSVVVLANAIAGVGERPTPIFVEGIINTMDATEDDKERVRIMEKRNDAAHFHAQGGTA